MKLGRHLVSLGLLGLACNGHDPVLEPTPQVGKVTISLQQPPAQITRVVATLSRQGFADLVLTLDRTDSTQSASGSFGDVPVGTWHLEVTALDVSNIVRFRGATDVEVLGGRTADVDLELLPTGGSIRIRVRWGAACVSLPADCVSWWPGDGNAADIHGTNSGTIAGGVTFAPAVAGRGFHFDGSTGGVAVSDADDLKLTGSLCIEAWIAVEGLPNPASFWGQILFRGDSRSGLDPYTLGISPDGRLVFHIASADSVAEIGTPVSLGNFMHVAASLDSVSGAMRLYVDGTLASGTTTTVRPFRNLDPTSSPGVGIGNTQGGSTIGEPFHGFIDELAVYRRALSASEIEEIYRAGHGGKCTSASTLLLFGDEFEGSSIVTSKWRLVPGNGSVSVSGGRLTLQCTAGGIFPYLVPKTNPIPAQGDFVVRVGMSYTSPASAGTGFRGTREGLDPTSAVGFDYWEDTCCGGLRADAGTSYFTLAQSAVTSYHTYEWRCVGQTYSFYFDGHWIGSGPSPARPTSFFFGHPPIISLPAWSSQEIDYVRVESLAQTN